MNATVEILDRAEITSNGVIVEYSHTEAALSALTEKYKNKTYDLTTTIGDKEARAARSELVSLRTALEKRRKAFKAPAIEFGKLIDSEAKRITDRILEIEQPIDDQIKADEKRRAAEKEERERIENERIANIQAKINRMRNCVTNCNGITSIRIQSGIEQVSQILITQEEYAEFFDAAQKAKADTLAGMKKIYEETKVKEDEILRIEAQRIENERIATELKAQQEAIDKEKRALQEQQEAINQAQAMVNAKTETEKQPIETPVPTSTDDTHNQVQSIDPPLYIKPKESPIRNEIIKLVADHYQVDPAKALKTLIREFGGAQ